ncbi:hypothetical protein KKA53_03455 [Candidatus Dependentiae bacterium]|nr:hypothetical protein [Candidatus Dependentiae bacterium]
MAENKIIETIELFPKINAELIKLLRSLSPEEWVKETVLPGRSVKDIASHIFDTSTRKLSMQRDGYYSEKPEINSYQDLVDFIQKLNSDWIKVSRRFSPSVLIVLLEVADKWLYDFMKTLDPVGKAEFNVAWAGEEESTNWFDTAREYTEKWHHQMQIRLALGKTGINSRELMFPVIDTFMRGLPYAYRDVKRDGTVKVEVTGEAGDIWYLIRPEGKWQLVDSLQGVASAGVKLSDDIAWKLFSDTVKKEDVEGDIEISGDRELALPVLDMRTVMR